MTSLRASEPNITNVLSGGTSFTFVSSSINLRRFAVAAAAADLIALQFDPVVRSRSAIGSLVVNMATEEAETASTRAVGRTSKLTTGYDAGISLGQAMNITYIPGVYPIPMSVRAHLRPRFLCVGGRDDAYERDLDQVDPGCAHHAASSGRSDPITCFAQPGRAGDSQHWSARSRGAALSAGDSPA